MAVTLVALALALALVLALVLVLTLAIVLELRPTCRCDSAHDRRQFALVRVVSLVAGEVVDGDG